MSPRLVTAALGWGPTVFTESSCWSFLSIAACHVGGAAGVVLYRSAGTCSYKVSNEDHFQNLGVGEWRLHQHQHPCPHQQSCYCSHTQEGVHPHCDYQQGEQIH